MMNSSSEMVKETSRLEMMAGATIGSVTRRKVPKARLAEIGGGLLQAAVEALEAGDQHRHRIGDADQHMAEHDGEQRQARARAAAARCSSEIATMISGSTSGAMIRPLIARCGRESGSA